MQFDTQGNYNGQYIGTPVHRLLPDYITVLTSDTFSRNQKFRSAYEMFIDDFGARSAKAQGLNHVITTLRKIMHTDHRLYVLRSERAILGILKVGRKNLFIRDLVSGKINEIAPLCVLDFYVHESEQRSGCGRRLFDCMLQAEKTDPSQLGYDRPSPKLLGFLRKHFALSDFDPQPNNFVVFKAYFRTAQPPSNPHHSLLPRGHAASAAPTRRVEAPWEHEQARASGGGGGGGGGGAQGRGHRREDAQNQHVPFFLGGGGGSGAGGVPGGSRGGSRRQGRGSTPSAPVGAQDESDGVWAREGRWGSEGAKDSLEVFASEYGGGNGRRLPSAGRKPHASPPSEAGSGASFPWGGPNAVASHGQPTGWRGEERGSGTAHWQRSGAAIGAHCKGAVGAAEREGGMVGAARMDRRVGNRLW